MHLLRLQYLLMIESFTFTLCIEGSTQFNASTIQYGLLKLKE
jgi:hypothetical protein